VTIRTSIVSNEANTDISRATRGISRVRYKYLLLEASCCSIERGARLLFDRMISSFSTLTPLA
jgi:hypothetical protein